MPSATAGAWNWCPVTDDIPTEMQAVVFSPQSADGRVIVTRLPVPQAQPGTVLVRLTHSALNRRDALIAAGEYLPTAPQSVMGSDGVGIIARVGPECSCTMGDRVVINPVLEWGALERIPDRRTIRTLGVPDDGTFAEFLRIPCDNIRPAPPHLSDVEAAALPLAGLTAHRALFSRGGLAGGETVLITGIGGGVSIFALQMAVAVGARVFVTSRTPDNIDAAVRLGAAGGVSTEAAGWEGALRGQMGRADLVVDSVGGDDFALLPGLCTEGARIVVLGAVAGSPPDFPVPMLFYKQLDVRGTSVGSPRDFDSMLALVEQHKIRPVVSAEFDLADFAEGLSFLVGARPPGKVVFRHTPNPQPPAGGRSGDSA